MANSQITPMSRSPARNVEVRMKGKKSADLNSTLLCGEVFPLRSVVVMRDRRVTEKRRSPYRASRISGRTYGPLIKRSNQPQSEPTQHKLSEGKTEDPDKP